MSTLNPEQVVRYRAVNHRRRGFVPVGHNAIMVINVIEAFPHPSGAWLSLQAIGPAIALVWRASDAYSATATEAAVVCETLDFDENYALAKELVEILLSEGPPEGLLQNAERSRKARSEKASNAAKARHARKDTPDKTSEPNLNSSSATADCTAELERGPAHNPAEWRWEQEEESQSVLRVWSLHRDVPGECGLMYVYVDRYGVCDLRRNWGASSGGGEDWPVRKGTLQQCFAVMEAAVKRGILMWREGDAF